MEVLESQAQSLGWAAETMDSQVGGWSRLSLKKGVYV